MMNPCATYRIVFTLSIKFVAGNKCIEYTAYFVHHICIPGYHYVYELFVLTTLCTRS